MGETVACAAVFPHWYMASYIQCSAALLATLATAPRVPVSVFNKMEFVMSPYS